MITIVGHSFPQDSHHSKTGPGAKTATTHSCMPRGTFKYIHMPNSIACVETDNLNFFPQERQGTRVMDKENYLYLCNAPEYTAINKMQRDAGTYKTVR